MISILFVMTNSALNRGMNTGIENLAWALASNNIKVHILSGGSVPKKKSFTYPSNVEYHFTGESGDNPASFILSYKRIVSEFDISIVSGWVINIALLAHERFGKEIKFVACLGQMPPRSVYLSLIKRYLNNKISLLEMFKIAKALYVFPKLCSRVISVSSAVNDASVSAYRLDRAKCRVIYRGVDTEIFYPLPRAHSDTVRLLYAGNIVESKGVGDLIRALQYVDIPISLELCGKVSDEYKQSLQNIIKVFPVKHQVVFCGVKSREELINFYRNSDVFVFPSHKEGLGKALLEAMACGCVVLASDIDVFKEVIQAGFNGLLFEVKCEKKLAKAISSIIADKALRKKLSENAVITIHQHFSSSHEINAWTSEINEIRS